MKYRLTILLFFITFYSCFSWNVIVITVLDTSFLQLSETFLIEEMGKRELTGKNDGKHITKYMKSCYLSGKKHYPYCAAGQVYCLDKATDSLKLDYPFSKHSAVANFHYTDAITLGKKINRLPKAHDFIIWKHLKGNSGHIERIDSIINEYKFITYAFNTSNGKNGSQRNGNGNYKRIRSLHPILGKMRLRGFVGFKQKIKIRAIGKSPLRLCNG